MTSRKHPGRAFWAIVVIIVGFLAYSGYVGYSTFTTALDAEYDLHALVCTLELFEEFVKRNDRWPKSWDELERLSDVRPPSMYEWPTDRAKIESRVTTDFDCRLAELAALPKPGLLPIRVHSRYYDFSHRYVRLFDAIKQTVRTTDRGG